MKDRIYRALRFWLPAALVLVTIGVFTTRVVVFWKIERSILAQVASLRSEGMMIRYSSLTVDSWDGSIRITDLDVRTRGTDALCHTRASVADLYVYRIAVFPALFKNKLVIDSVLAVHPALHHANLFDTTAQRPMKGIPFRGLEIRSLTIDSGKFETITNLCRSTSITELDVTLSDLQGKNLGSDSVSWEVSHAGARNMRSELPEALYRITATNSSYSSKDQSLVVDSIRMTPTLGRLEFAQKSRHQIDQITCEIPRIRICGFDLTQLARRSIAAQHIDFQFKGNVYRDKQFPNATRTPSILPAQLIRRLPFLLEIDSITISSSAVSYQEVPETGGVPGIIFFDSLEAVIYNISSRPEGEAVMNVKSRFMGAGDLEARFTFPMQEGKPNTIRASLRDFAMPEINPMLRPIANMDIEQGVMQELNFEFQYDENQSTGKLDLRYTGLKVSTIRHNEHRTTNKFVSFLVNVMVQNTMDKYDPKYKRSGVILWSRNSQSGMINYWWNSILSGLKSVFRLDRILGLKA